jgi:hypothetical protein
MPLDPKEQIHVPFKRRRPAINVNSTLGENRGRSITYTLLIVIAMLAALYFGVPRKG